MSDEELAGLLKAAMAAPSAGNQQSWHFVVIRDREMLARVPEVHPYAEMVPSAAAAIVVCGDSALARHPGYWVQDCAAATQNILVAARAMGLGAVWLGIHPREDRVEGIRGLLEIPDQIVPVSMIPVGHPAEEKPPAERYDETKIHHDRW